MKIYDFEHHFYAQELIDLIASRKECPCMDETLLMHISETTSVPMSQRSYNGNGNILQSLTDISEERLEIMDAQDLQCGVLSTSDCLELLPRDEAVAMAKVTNDKAAEAVKKYPGRFLGTLCLPTPYVEESIEELNRAVKELGLQYWHTHSAYGKERLSDDKYDPLLAECAKLNVPFYIHPSYPTDDYLLNGGAFLAGASFAFCVDTMKTAMKLVLKGTFDRYPDLKMILGHMAEFLPYIMGRVDNMLDVLQLVDPDGTLDPSVRCKKTFAEYFRHKNIFMSTSGVFDLEIIQYVIRVIGVDNILYGSDYPYEDLKHSMDFMKNLPVSAEDKAKIFYGNAEKYILKL